MFLVGLTGGIATGKSTTASLFNELGITVIDADVIAKKVVEPGRPAWKKIKTEFPSVINEDDTIDRRALGQIIFSDKEKRRKLDDITHFYIFRMMIWEIVKCFFSFKHQYIILDLPLLFESGTMLDYVYKIIVVTSDYEQQVERLMTRNQFNKQESENRIKSQMPLEEKCGRANFVIDNSGSYEETRQQITSTHKVLCKSKHHRRIIVYVFMWLFVITGSVCWLIWLFLIRRK